MKTLTFNCTTKNKNIEEIIYTDEEVSKIQKYNQNRNLTEELNNLVFWFEEYDNQIKQYERCQRLGIEFDKDIKELDNIAKINQERIREIRNLLK